MKIYICHSSGFDYKKELYEPIRKSTLNNKYQFILPHEKSSEVFDSKKIIPTSDLVIAEVSYQSTAMGIEIGWSDSAGKKIVYIFKKGAKVSASLQAVSREFIEYGDRSEMINKLTHYLENVS